MLSGISQNKMSILERADRPDWSFGWTSDPNLRHNNPSLYFQTLKTSKVEKVSAWIPQSITSVSDRLSPVVLVPWCWHSLRPVFVPKPKTGNLTSEFRLLKSCPTPKNVEPLTRAIREHLSCSHIRRLLCLNVHHIRRKHWLEAPIFWKAEIFWPKSVNFNIRSTQ